MLIDAAKCRNAKPRGASHHPAFGSALSPSSPVSTCAPDVTEGSKDTAWV